MDHYLDFLVLDNPEIGRDSILAMLFDGLHQAFIHTNNTTMGISFPKVKAHASPPTLGNVLRLHGTLAEITHLIALPALSKPLDYVRTSPPTAVPPQATFCSVTRQQVKSNADRLRRRAMRRHDLTMEQAIQRIPDTVMKTSNAPYLIVRSRSTQQSFRLFLLHSKTQASAIKGTFNAYGLSSNATIPWF